MNFGQCFRQLALAGLFNLGIQLFALLQQVFER